MELVSDTEGQEERFDIQIMHGLCLNVKNFTSYRYSGSFEANHYTVDSYPWQTIIFGDIPNCVEYLRFVVSEMKSWKNDDDQTPVNQYPCPLTIASIIRWSENEQNEWSRSQMGSCISSATLYFQTI